MEQNNSDDINIPTNGNKLGITIIPFNYRKSPILSIIFRSLDLEMGKFRLKIELDDENDSKTQFFSNYTEMTLVRQLNFIFIIIYRFLNFN